MFDSGNSPGSNNNQQTSSVSNSNPNDPISSNNPLSGVHSRPYTNPSYNSYGNSGYNSQYGSSYMGNQYSSGYGSSYGGGYGSSGSFGSYGNYNSPYSNTYSKPMPNQGPANGQMPPQNLRHDVWGFLNGFHAMLNVLYAGTGIVHFGKMFFKMSMKIIKAICGKSAGIVFKLTGLSFLKKVMTQMSSNDDWFGEFGVADKNMENIWGTNTSSTNNTLFGKAMLVVRILSLMGALVTIFLRNRVNNNAFVPIQAETMGPEMAPMDTQLDIRQDMNDFKNLYEEIKLIEGTQPALDIPADSIAKLTKDMDKETEEIKSETKESSDEEIKAVEPKESELKLFDESEASSPTFARKSSDITTIKAKLQQTLDEKLTKLPSDILSEASSPKLKINTKLTSRKATQDVTPTLETLPAIETPVSAEKVEVQENVTVGEIVPVPENTQVKPEMDKLVAEDFWKTDQVFEQIRQNEREAAAAKEQAKKEEFELPSVLKTLKQTPVSSAKPWFMKKKSTLPTPTPVSQEPISVEAKNIEVVAEPPVDFENAGVPRLSAKIEDKN